MTQDTPRRTIGIRGGQMRPPIPNRPACRSAARDRSRRRHGVCMTRSLTPGFAGGQFPGTISRCRGLGHVARAAGSVNCVVANIRDTRVPTIAMPALLPMQAAAPRPQSLRLPPTHRSVAAASPITPGREVLAGWRTTPHRASGSCREGSGLSRYRAKPGDQLPAVECPGNLTWRRWPFRLPWRFSRLPCRPLPP